MLSTKPAESFVVTLCSVDCIQIIEEVIHEEDEEVLEDDRSYVSERHLVAAADEATFALPQQTYHHMLGRSFGVAFNDRSFLSPDLTSSAAAADRYYYGSLGICQSHRLTSNAMYCCRKIASDDIK